MAAGLLDPYNELRPLYAAPLYAARLTYFSSPTIQPICSRKLVSSTL